jgi:hypothetical protein
VSAELEIPQAAADAWFHCGCEKGCDRAGYQPEAIPLIVAAELRRLIDTVLDRDPAADVHAGPVSLSDLLARVYELDPDGAA